MNESLKVTVQSFGWVTAAGWVCSNWREYWVVIGKNPKGPRGGTTGVISDGYTVGHRYRTRADALKRAQEIAIENNYELI